jgi:hypothetical protein
VAEIMNEIREDTAMQRSSIGCDATLVVHNAEDVG